MNWNCFDFDPSDELAHVYLKYKGEYYDKGTIVKLHGRNGPIVARWTGWNYKDQNCFELISESDYINMYRNYTRADTNKYIIEIVVPVKPILQKTEHIGCGFGSPNRDKPPSWDVEVAWIWYIVIMFILLFFKARWLGWIATTIIFFGWKNGFFNNKK